MAEAYNEEVYYFVARHENLYYPVFFSWILVAIVEDFSKLSDDKTFIHVELTVPNHRFVADVDKPLFLFNIKSNIQPHLGDDNILDLCPDGKCSNALPRFVPYPAYFKKSVESLFEYKLWNKLYQRAESGWQIII